MKNQDNISPEDLNAESSCTSTPLLHLSLFLELSCTAASFALDLNLLPPPLLQTPGFRRRSEPVTKQLPSSSISTGKLVLKVSCALRPPPARTSHALLLFLLFHACSEDPACVYIPVPARCGFSCGGRGHYRLFCNGLSRQCLRLI